MTGTDTYYVRVSKTPSDMRREPFRIPAYTADVLRTWNGGSEALQPYFAGTVAEARQAAYAHLETLGVDPSRITDV